MRKLSLLGLLMLLTSLPALADTIDITVPNTALSAYSGPYATVTISLTDSTHAAVTFSANTTDGHAYLIGGQDAADLSVNGPFTVGSFSTTGAPGFTAPTITQTFGPQGFKEVSEFGRFNLTLDASDGYKDAFETLSFVLSLSSGTWASAADVLVANERDYVAAAHIYVPNNNPPTPGGGAILTGFAGNGKTPVPEPGTLVLVGSGLLSMGFMVRRRK